MIDTILNWLIHHHNITFFLFFGLLLAGLFRCDGERDRTRNLRPSQQKAINDACEAFKRLGAAFNRAGISIRHSHKKFDYYSTSTESEES
jgi:hypothetical protein